MVFMTRRAFTALFAAACGAALSGCSMLTAFATLTPKDPADRLAAGRDQFPRYGEKSGLRFSLNAVIPSWASADPVKFARVV